MEKCDKPNCPDNGQYIYCLNFQQRYHYTNCPKYDCDKKDHSRSGYTIEEKLTDKASFEE